MWMSASSDQANNIRCSLYSAEQVMSCLYISHSLYLYLSFVLSSFCWCFCQLLTFSRSQIVNINKVVASCVTVRCCVQHTRFCRQLLVYVEMRWTASWP